MPDNAFNPTAEEVFSRKQPPLVGGGLAYRPHAYLGLYCHWRRAAVIRARAGVKVGIVGATRVE